MGHSRRGKPNKTRQYHTPKQIEGANRRAFHEEAWNQRVCAMCGKGGGYQSHHVIEKQKLRIIGRLDLKWDVRNALRVCNDCHEAHTNGSHRIKLDRLTDANYDFAWFVLGMESGHYLRARYNGTDPRWAALVAKCDEALEDARASA